MLSAAEADLIEQGHPDAAKTLCKLHPMCDWSSDDADAMMRTRAAAKKAAQKSVIRSWDSLYLPSSSFDIERRIVGEPIGSGTFCDVYNDEARPGHVVLLARFSFDGSTTEDSDDAASFAHYANTLDATLRIRKASHPEREPVWAAVPHAFTLYADMEGQVWFIFFMRRCTPLEDHPAFCVRHSRPEGLKKLMWSVVVSAWFVENEAGLAHRDIKPANVLVTPEGRAVLSDFGSARPLGCSGNPGYYMNPPWMSPAELISLRHCRNHVWHQESSAFAVGLLMLRSCWPEREFLRYFPQGKKKCWVDNVIAHRKEGFDRRHRSLLDQASERKYGGLELAALMLANPSDSNRSTLAFIERMLRDNVCKNPAALLTLPPALQRSGDIPVKTLNGIIK